MTSLEERAIRLQAQIPDGMDAVLVTSEINTRYLTGFHYTDGFILITHGGTYAFADSRYIEAARREICSTVEVRLLSGKRSDLLGGLIAEHSIQTVGFEDTEMTCAALAAWERAFPNLTFAPIGTLIEDMREHKDAGEIECIVRAQRIAEAAFDHILGYINPDRTEAEVALELEYFMRQKGADGVAFETIAVSGSASSMPHGVPRPVKLEKGFLTMDYGALYGGYCSDMTRTVCLGHATEEMKQVYQTVYEAQMAANDAICLGMLCSDVDKIARDIIDASPFRGTFGHSLGHGVGMYIHESPRLSFAAGDKRLEVGHVVTLEPGIYLEGKFGVRIEDMVAMTENGPVNLTRCPKNLIEL